MMRFNNGFLVLSILCCLCTVLEARGGRGGGGGGGRGGGGRTVSRAPTMSRGGMDRARDMAPNRAESAPQMRQSLQTFASGNRSNLDQRNLNQARQNLQGNWSGRQNLAQGIRDNVNRDGINRGNMFNDNFWGAHRFDPYYRTPGANLWRAASWRGLNDWLGWGWGDPYYYDSGYPITVDNDPGVAYLAQDDVQSAPQTTEPAAPQNANWMPLGVFALSSNENTPTDPTMFVQIVLGKDGNLAGAYYNQSTDQLYPITGVVDKSTQKAVWKNSPEQGAPIFQTGLYNLTKSSTPVTVTYSNGITEEWFLVRLKDKDG